MDVSEAIKTRKTCRAFLDKPISKEILLEILEKAMRSPSGGNLQPWRVYVVTGKVIEEINKVYELQSASISRKHTEIIIRQMFSRRKIKDAGETNFYFIKGGCGPEENQIFENPCPRYKSCGFRVAVIKRPGEHPEQDCLLLEIGRSIFDKSPGILPAQL